MKDLFKNGFLIVLAIGLLYMIFLRECKSTKCPPSGSVLVTEVFLDSLRSIADRPPVIIIKDTIIYRDTIIYLNKPIPSHKPDSVLPNFNVYVDSLYNDSIRVWTEMTIDGTLEMLNQWYQPIFRIREITKEIPKPYPVPYEVPVSKYGIYLSGILGGNANSFAAGAGLDIINKKDNLYGIQYQRIGNQNFYAIRVGFKIKFK